MSSYKCFVYATLGLSFTLLGLLLVLLYIYDPLQLYHKPYFRHTAFSEDMRVQDKGIIKLYDFDSFILGTSMLMSTSAREASEKFGGKFVNISMAGSAFNERAVILRYLFTQKSEVKRVIYSLDMGEMVSSSPKSTSNYDFIYDENELDDIRIYMNEKYILCAFMWSSKEKCVGKEDLETLIYWALHPNADKAFGGFHKWLENSHLPIIANPLQKLKNIKTPYETTPFTGSISKAQDYINEYVFSFVVSHPNTKFEFIIPPYSRLFYRLESGENFAKFAAILRWFVKESQRYENARIYGFDDLDYLDDIANYGDAIHYTAQMNSFQLDAIKTNTHRITSENIDTYLAIMQSKIENYDITPLQNALKEWEQKR